MSAFQRRLDILDHIPRYPRKVSTRQIMLALENQGHEDITMRTVQRDLEQLYSLGMFGLDVDKRSKPHGWSVNLNWKKLNISVMDANAALAFSTLKDVGSTLLPESTLHDLGDYFDKAKTILNSDKSPLISHWKKSVALVNPVSPVSLPVPDPLALSEIKKAIFHKKQINAELKRYLVAKKEPIWKHYIRINPLGLIQQEYTVTLVCSIGSFHQKLYKFPIAFIRNIQVTCNEIVTPKDFNFESIKSAYFNTNHKATLIKLSLLARKDSYFVLSNGSFGPDQTMEETDNSDFVKISVTVHDTEKLRAFLRGLGPTIEVLTPLALRTYFKLLAQQYLAKYQ
ncbi:MAG: helix-turn-helix transcriptional regulator [Cognaticolwellia sp.]